MGHHTGAAIRQHEIVCVKTLNKLKVRFLLAELV